MLETREDPGLVQQPSSLETVDKQQITVIVNPASGVNRTALEAIQAFAASHQDVLETTIKLTQASGDAERFAREAAQGGADVVAAYGGDGTMMETAIGLRDTGVPMLMLPGGTANVMAIELGVPLALESALALVLDPTRQTREVDMGVIDSQPFLLRAGIGYEAEMSAQAERGEKSKKGRLAYVENALRALRQVQPSQYILTIDDQTYVRYGVTCMICNSTSIGIPNLRFVYNGNVSDGLLDVIVIENFRVNSLFRTLFQIVRSLLRREETGSAHLDHWQGKQVTVQMRTRQFVARDGEPVKRSKRVSAMIVPKAVSIIVPAPAAPPATADAANADPVA